MEGQEKTQVAEVSMPKSTVLKFIISITESISISLGFKKLSFE